MNPLVALSWVIGLIALLYIALSAGLFAALVVLFLAVIVAASIEAVR